MVEKREDLAETHSSSLSGVRGWLLVFCVSLTILNPVVGGGLAVRQIWLLEEQKEDLLREMSDEAYFKYTFPLYIDPIVTIGLVVFGFIAGLSLWTLETEGVKQALSFLNWVLRWTIIRGLIFSSFYEMTFDDIVSGVAGPIIYYLIWSAYLKKSKRVRETYPRAFTKTDTDEISAEAKESPQESESQEVFSQHKQIAVAEQPVDTLQEISKDAKNMAMLCHLLAIFTSFVAPLIIWLIKKDEEPFVDQQGKEALNFQITVILAMFVSALLSFICIGVLLLFAVPIVDLVFCIIASVKAGKGIAYRYPVSLRLVK